MNKLKFGLKEYFKPTPSKIARFQLAWKGIVASGGIMALSDSNWKAAIVIGILGFAINELFQLFGEHPELLAVEKASEALKEKVEEVTEEIIAEKKHE